MAHCRACLAVDPKAQSLNQTLTEVIDQLGLQVQEPLHKGAWLIASERPQRGRHAQEHVQLLCDWSNLRNTGELAIETRSGESMAHSVTRAHELLQRLCSRLGEMRAIG
jgi:hypothetical protein